MHSKVKFNFGPVFKYNVNLQNENIYFDDEDIQI